MVKKILYYLVNTLSVLLIVAALFALLSVVLTGRNGAPSILGHSLFRVVSGSMEPAIHENDMIIVKQRGAGEVKLGDVISFYSKDPALNSAVNTHRVTAIEGEGSERVFTTKGDANPVDDKYTVGAKELIGVVVFHSSFLGRLSRLLSNPVVFVPLIAVPLLVIMLTNMIKTIRIARIAAREEEEKALEEALEKIKRQKAEESAGQDGKEE